MKRSMRSALAAIVAALAGAGASSAQEHSQSPRIVEAKLLPRVTAYRQSLPEAVPPQPDFVAPILSDGPATQRNFELVPFQQTVPGFRVIPESGLENPEIIRLQISSDQYYQGADDGGTLNLTHQLLRLLPDVQFIAAIERKHVDGFLAHFRQWTLPASTRLTLCPQDLPVAQWAQDNGKSGRVLSADGKSRSVLLVPRYASRGEIETVFVPGESFLADSLAAAGLRVAQSPLLFQGGNLLPVYDSAAKKTLLLIGEAEIFRNAGLGLSEARILDAFRIEFGVDQCVVLPAASFHIDYEVSVRGHDGKMLALVNDFAAAHRMVIDIGLDVLGRHGLISAGELQQARQHLSAGRWTDAGAILDSLIARLGGSEGHFPLAMAEWFSGGPSDSGVGNLLRFLASCDYVCSFNSAASHDPQTRTFLQTIQASRVAREELVANLRTLGWTIMPIPSTSDDELSLNYLNGLQMKDRYLMPAYGGLYKALDDVAKSSFEKALPGIEIIGILCGESQRRNGALHCSISTQ